MTTWGSVIDLESRRPRPAASPSPPTPSAAQRQRRAMLLFFLLLSLPLVLFGITRGANLGSRSGVLLPQIRVLLYESAFGELKSACQHPSASADPLRSRCVDDARLLLLIPECDVACRTIVSAVLPHAR